MNDSCSMGIDYGFGEPGHSEKKKLPWLSGDITISISGVGWIVSPKKMCSFSNSTHEYYLFGNITFADVTYLEIWPLHMSLRILRADHSGLEWALNQVTSILPRQKKRDIWGQAHREKGHMKDRDWNFQSQARESWKCQPPKEGKREAWHRFPLGANLLTSWLLTSKIIRQYNSVVFS